MIVVIIFVDIKFIQMIIRFGFGYTREFIMKKKNVFSFRLSDMLLNGETT